MSMENENDVIQESSPEVVEAPIEEIVSEDVITPESAPIKTEEKVVPYDRFKKVNEELQALKKQPVKVVNNALNVEDYIDISASLDGLDQREKERLAKEHKLTGRPLSEIRKDEDFILWQKAYRDQAEKERLALKPSGTQSNSDKPNINQKLSDPNLSLSEREKILADLGLYKTPKPYRSDRTNIGNK